MCFAISWCELPNGEIKFVTGKQLFHTGKGKALIKKYPSSNDWLGHAIILEYHRLERLEGGCKERECTDFSTPANFPLAISAALKAGEYQGIITNDMLVMLTPAALKIYAAREKAYVDWEKAYVDREKAYAAWEKAAAAREKAYAAWKKAYVDWEKTDVAREKTDVAWEKAYAAWKKADVDFGVFWKLFADSANRIEAWR